MSKEKETQELKKIEDYVKSLRKDVDKRLTEIREQVRPVKRQATKVMTERPLLALGVAFVIGMAVGVALSKSTD